MTVALTKFSVGVHLTHILCCYKWQVLHTLCSKLHVTGASTKFSLAVHCTQTHTHGHAHSLWLHVTVHYTHPSWLHVTLSFSRVLWMRTRFRSQWSTPKPSPWVSCTAALTLCLTSGLTAFWLSATELSLRPRWVCFLSSQVLQQYLPVFFLHAMKLIDCDWL